MPTTPNKGFAVPTAGTEVDTWGTLLNTATFTVIDNNLGGIATKTLSNIPVVLSATESQMLILRLIGTLSADVLVTTLAKGMTIVENATSGAFTVTFKLDAVTGTVTIPQGTRAVIATDPANGALVAADNQTEFPSGTKLPFYQDVAPTGWTKQIIDSNIGVRITNGSDGGTIAGSANFTDIFTTRGLTGTVNGTAITEAQMATHKHFIANGSEGLTSTTLLSTNHATRSGGGSDGPKYELRATASDCDVGLSSLTGGGQSHDHSLTINNLNMSLRYMNMIVATKN